MKRTMLFIILALLAFGQTAWAQTYITDVLVIGYETQSDATDAYDSFVNQGWTGINHNLNSGTDGYYIYLMYKTESSPYSSGIPITDLYLRVSNSNDAPDDFTYDGRNYHLTYRSGGYNFMTITKGDLNCGAGGSYINLYYTKDAFSPDRVVTSIAIDNTSNNTAVSENGGTSPCDLNKGAGGDYIYLHVNKSMTGDVAVVHNEAELRDALTLNNANIQFGNHIYLSCSLVIEHNRTATIDLNGYILNRALRKHANNGEVFNVINGSTLNISNGTLAGGYGDDGGAIQNKGITNLTGVTITGNTANDRGGGIGNKNGGTLNMTNCTISNNYCNDKTDPRGGGGLFNAEGATATLTNVTITGNAVAQYGGSGICNYGTLTLDGGTITGNSAKSDGGGIWTNGTLNLQGAITITGNTITNGQLSNLYLKSGKVVTVTGSLAGSNIGIYMLTQGTFTNGYSTYHSGTHPNTIFTSDQNSNVSIDINSQEAQIDLFYIDREWDDWDRVVTKTTLTLAADQYTVLNGGGDINLNSGIYVVKDNVTYDFIYMDDGGEHHLVLCDGATLNAKHINVEGNNKLHIYGQIKDIGKIVVKDMDGSIAHAGIGGRGVNTGTIVIHGGYVQAQGGYEAHFTYNYGGAGIGGARYGNGGTVIILGGTVVAYSYGEDAAGIGGGYDGNGGDVTIHGGNVTAQGGLKGAGIGSGHNSTAEIITSSGSLTVTGGEVYAYGGAGAAGIGGGYDFSGGDVTIYGGFVHAEGGGNGAGIGSGCEYTFSERVDGGWLTVYGGRVEAYGGVDGAGIGGGEDADCDHVTINGGYVYAEGNDYGAGIGGGERGKGGYVTINGGTVIAKAGARAPRAIGAGDDNDINGSLTFGSEMMVSSERKANADEREDMCWNRTQVRVEPCSHEDAGSYTSNGVYVYFWDCPHCGQYHGTAPYTFLTAGNWHDNTNWLGNEIAFIGSDVIVKAAATITNGRVVDLGNITLKDGGSITIGDGCQLFHTNAGVKATVQKSITGHGEGLGGGWNFIASPLTGNITPKSENGFLTDDYDLYFYEEPRHYWRNFKPDGLYQGFDIEPKTGYLYANEANTTLSFTGTLQTGTLSDGKYICTVDNLSYVCNNENLRGWNLVGNPFPCNAVIDKPCYTIVGDAINPEAHEANSYFIPPCTGVMVKATENNQSVTFTKTTNSASQGRNLQITLSQAVSTRGNAKIDNAIVSFTEGNDLEKFVFNADNAKLYIPQGGKDYAIVFSEGQDEMPLNFKATENGEYIISVNPEGVELAYLHLVDNITGADVELLATNGGDTRHCVSTYTFEAKTTDYESRFKLVFVTNEEDGPSTSPEAFAFNSNGNWIISNGGEAILQVIDINGRILCSESINGSVSKAIEAAPGVYVLRLVNGDDVRMQKIVIR